MQPYCTSSSFSRRDFLKILLGLCGLAGGVVALSQCNGKSQARAIFQWKEPVWIWDLQASPQSPSAIQGPTQASNAIVPYGMPGSVMKLITATALLEDGLLSPNTIFICNGRVKQDGQWIVCPHAHGRLTVQQAIGFSCNVFFAQAVSSLSRNRLIHYARLFQLDRPFQGFSGLVNHQQALKNNLSTKKTDLVEAPFKFTTEGLDAQPLPLLALGLAPQIQPNALQLLRVAKHIAQHNIPQIRPQTWEILQQGMRLAARAGTAHALDPADHFKLAVKTGTVAHGQRFNGWLIGYFPFDQPRYAVCVYAQEGTARDSAVPLLRHFLAQREKG